MTTKRATPDLGIPFEAGDLILAAVSGGADSVFLAIWLLEQAPAKKWRIEIVHVHHHQRAEEADGDAAFVQTFAQTRGIECHVVHLEPERFTADDSLEAQMRESRLRALHDLARLRGAKAIALGHHANDAAETFLLMALRGSGPTGLGSLREVRWIENEGVWLYRPLLQRSRIDIEGELRRRQQLWRRDSTNESMDFRRNRLRAEVIPLLLDIEPGTIGVLARSAALCAEESALLAEMAGEAAERVRLSSLEKSTLLDAHGLREMNPTLAKIVIRSEWTGLLQRVYAKTGPNRVEPACVPLPPPHSFLENLHQRVLNPQGEESQMGSTGGVAVTATNNLVLLHAEDAHSDEELAAHFRRMRRVVFLPPAMVSVPVHFSTQRTIPQTREIPLPNGQGKLVVSIKYAQHYRPNLNAPEYRTQHAAIFDAELVRGNLVLQNAHDNGRIEMGSGGGKYLPSVLQEAGIPAGLRDRVAVLADERGVLWVPGVRRAVEAYIRPTTTICLMIAWEPEE